MFFATVRFTVAKNPDKCPNLRTVGNYMSNCRKKRTSLHKSLLMVVRLLKDIVLIISVWTNSYNNLFEFYS